MPYPADLRERRPLGSRLRQGLLLTAIMLGSLSFYLAVLWWRGPHAHIVTRTRWDEFIPFYPAWVWVYLVPYLIGPIIAALLTRATFAWYVRRGIPLVLLSVAIFAIVPTKTLRPTEEVAGDGPTARLYRNMITIDGPAANAAPSLHVSLTCLLAWALVRDFPRWWLVTLLSVGLVWLSTLLTYQHHLIDVATGALLGILVALPWPKGRACRRPES